MKEPAVSLDKAKIDKIKTEAREAAARYTNVNAACPYPFGTAEAAVFKEEFLWVRLVIEEKGGRS
jgi:hypothetical protein